MLPIEQQAIAEKQEAQKEQMMASLKDKISVMKLENQMKNEILKKQQLQVKEVQLQQKVSEMGIRGGESAVQESSPGQV